MSNELIHDVEESLKQERMHALWNEYGPYLITGVVLAVLFTALIAGYRSWQYKVNTSNTALLIQAMNAPDVTSEIETIVDEFNPGQRAVARLSQGGIYLTDGQPEKAWEAFTAAAADSALPEPYRSFAQVQAVRVGWGGNYGETATSDYINSLEPIIEDDDNPWRFHARYQAALMAGQDIKDYDLALSYLMPVVKSPAAPPTLVQQAQALNSLYSIRAQATSDTDRRDTDNADTTSPEGS